MLTLQGVQGVLSKLNAAKEMMKEFVTREKRKQVRQHSSGTGCKPCLPALIKSYRCGAAPCVEAAHTACQLQA